MILNDQRIITKVIAFKDSYPLGEFQDGVKPDLVYPDDPLPK